MRRTICTLATCLAFAAPAAADGPVLVELYTSQGCSSCPPADALMHELAQRSDVIPLALHVDYWDYIGWADNFANPEHTARQQGYARVAGARSIYTPQMIIGGEDHVIGTKPMELADNIMSQKTDPTGVDVSISRSGDQVHITGQTARNLPNGTVVQIVRYTPEQTVSIRRGENAGRELSYANIVTDWRAVGEWRGTDDLDMVVDVTGTEPIVVVVQEPGPGSVMATAVLR